MNVVKEIQSINAKELASGGAGSWHDQYKDSAYIYVGGLAPQLTEGDVITIFSQYGEVVDISLPRDQTTQKAKGFAFLMYADQRSTVLAVDNLGGSKVLERTLKVDHVLNYKQLKKDDETGKMVEREEQSLAAHPDKFKPLKAGSDSDSDAESVASSHPSIDIDDPMRDYMIQLSRENKKSTKAIKGSNEKSSKRDRKENESKEERKERRDRKKKKLGLSITDGNERDKGKGKEREPRAEEARNRREREPEKTYSGDSRRNGGREKASDHYSESRDDRRDHPRGDDSRRGDDGARRADDRRDDYRREDDSRRDSSRRDGDRRDEGRKASSYADLEKWATR